MKCKFGFFCGLIRGLRNLEASVGSFCARQKEPKKHTECAVPAGTNFLRSGKFQKDLILLVESCCLGRLNRGSQNLELPERGTVLFFSLVRKERGVPQRFANLWTPGTIQISARFVILAENDRHSSSNRPRRALRGFRVSPVRI